MSDIQNEEMGLKQALEILRLRRQKNIEDTLDALTLAATMLDLIREDTFAARVLDIKRTFQTYIAKENGNALEIGRRPFPHQESQNSGPTETMVEGRKLGSKVDGRRSPSDPRSKLSDSELAAGILNPEERN